VAHPNQQLAAVLAEAGASGQSLARRVNALAARVGLRCTYTHTSVANWTRRGMTPKPPIPQLIAQALSERLTRPVTVGEIGMTQSETTGFGVGLDFPRDLSAALRNTTDLWSDVDRRNLFTAAAGTFAVAAFSTPVTRWLVRPADPPVDHRGNPRRVEASDIDGLHAAAEQARQWDSQYGGGDWRTTSLTRCLHHQAAPLLHATYTHGRSTLRWPHCRTVFWPHLGGVAGW
jgi:hypothetical protein